MMAVEIESAPVKDRAYWLEWNLQNWARWMAGSEVPEGLPDRACGELQNYTTMYGDSELEYDKLDGRLAESTNAAIEGLASVAEQCAIYNAYGVASVFRLRHGPETLVMARLHVAASLERRGIYLGD